MIINCLVIDDEPSSQNILKKFISDVDFLNLSGVCNNAIEALQKLKKNPSINLLFLDINMPKISGLTFYNSLQNPPKVIFTTAYPKYAVDGFEVNAIDFLLKPFSFERFFTATAKALDSLQKQDSFSSHSNILLKSNKVLHKVNTKDILFIEAYGDYVKFYLKEKLITTNSTFTNSLQLLPDNIFVRTHKSFSVNTEKIESVNANKITIGKHIIPIGQKYKEQFFEFLNNNA